MATAHPGILLALLTIAACGDFGLDGSERVISPPIALDTGMVSLSVDPPFVKEDGQSSLCIALDTSSHVVELPHMVLRPRTGQDTTYAVLAMERRTEDAITISAELESMSQLRAPVAISMYISSHELCFGLPIDSIARVRVRSSRPLATRGVAFATTRK
jgi:hypothetical protein